MKLRTCVVSGRHDEIRVRCRREDTIEGSHEDMFNGSRCHTLSFSLLRVLIDRDVQHAPFPPFSFISRTLTLPCYETVQVRSTKLVHLQGRINYRVDWQKFQLSATDVNEDTYDMNDLDDTNDRFCTSLLIDVSPIMREGCGRSKDDCEKR